MLPWQPAPWPSCVHASKNSCSCSPCQAQCAHPSHLGAHRAVQPSPVWCVRPTQVVNWDPSSPRRPRVRAKLLQSGSATLWTVPQWLPLSMGFSWQEYWTGLPCPPPGDLPNPEIKPAPLSLLHWQVGSLPLVPHGKPKDHMWFIIYHTHHVTLSEPLSIPGLWLTHL